MTLSLRQANSILLEVDPKYFCPAEVETLLVDPTKAKNTLGWNSTKTSFKELVHIMMQHDLDYVEKDRTLHKR